jgi:hypothetical protein
LWLRLARTRRYRVSRQKALQLDLALADYGPEAKNFRLQLRDGLGKTIDGVWRANESDANFAANSFAAALHNMRAREQALDAFHPSTDAQTQALAAAKAASEAIGQSRLECLLRSLILFPTR